MAPPITWQNVNGPSLSEALRPMTAAQDSFNQAFTGLGAVVDDQQRIAQAGVDRQREAAVQSVLGALAGAKTPEQLAALQSSPDFQRMMAAVDPRDASRVRGQDEQRLAAVRSLVAGERTAMDQDFLYQNRELLGRARAAASTGDLAGAQAALAPLMQNPATAGWAAQYYSEVTGTGRTAQRAEEEFKDRLLTSSTNRTNDTSRAESDRIRALAARSSAGAAWASANTQREGLDLSRMAALEGRLVDAIARANAADGERVGSRVGAAEVEKTLIGMKLPAHELSTLRAAVGKVMKDFPELPVSAVIGLAQDSRNTKWFFSDTFGRSDRGNDIYQAAKDLRGAMQSRLEGEFDAKGAYLTQINRIQTALDAALSKQLAKLPKPGRQVPALLQPPAAAPQAAPPAPLTPAQAMQLIGTTLPDQSTVDRMRWRSTLFSPPQ